jgi:hypothetical protein
VHGDFSPKNILIGSDRMVLLDCEAAWYGDAAFATFWQEYALVAGDTIEARLPRLLLMLLLARMDGKSPVEYLTQPQRTFVRSFVSAHLPGPMPSFSELSDAWFAEIAGMK